MDMRPQARLHPRASKPTERMRQNRFDAADGRAPRAGNRPTETPNNICRASRSLPLRRRRWPTRSSGLERAQEAVSRQWPDREQHRVAFEALCVKLVGGEKHQQQQHDRPFVAHARIGARSDRRSTMPLRRWSSPATGTTSRSAERPVSRDAPTHPISGGCLALPHAKLRPSDHVPAHPRADRRSDRQSAENSIQAAANPTMSSGMAHPSSIPSSHTMNGRRHRAGLTAERAAIAPTNSNGTQLLKRELNIL